MDNFTKSVSAAQYDLYKFSQFLYNRRMQAKVNQTQFAQYLGMKLANYQRYEAGKIKRIPLEMVKLICEKFGVEETEFLMTREPYTDNIKIAKWLGSEASRPYILEAYKKYLDDQHQKHEQEAQDVFLRIREATYGKTDIPDFKR